MKRFLLTMTILMVVFGNMVAQDRSIRFEEGSYQEALNKAKKENKLVSQLVCLQYGIMSSDIILVRSVAEWPSPQRCHIRRI